MSIAVTIVTAIDIKMPKKNSLTIVISTYNRAGSLDKCLASLTKQTDKKFEVLVIDGGSNDKTQSVVDKYKKGFNIKKIVDKTPHLAYIRDLGRRRAKTDLVGWVDDDAVVGKRWVEAVKAVFAKTAPPIGGVTGPTFIPKKLLRKRDVFYFHTTKSALGKLLAKIYFNLFLQGERYGIGKIYPSGAWSPGANFPKSRKLEKPLKVDYLEACNFVIRRKVLKEIGGYNLGYKKTSEWCEVDLAFRIRKAGYRLIFDPKIAVEHFVSSAGAYTRRFDSLSRLKNFLRFYFFVYYPKTLRGYILFALYFIFQLVYYFYLYIAGQPQKETPLKIAVVSFTSGKVNRGVETVVC